MSGTDFPFSETVPAESPQRVAEIVRAANAAGTAVYPIGGGTSLHMGLPPVREGIALRLDTLDRVIDYPARDMTITVASGMTIDALQSTLAPEAQRLPIDAPQANVATLGGLIATNHSGPLRYGLGTIRDYVIGIRAVDGQGEAFAAGGRVVKNVAGYDFCKLLTGSLGTLGVITEVTLKLKPIPAVRRMAVCRPRDLDHLEALLAALVRSRTAPAAVEYLAGSGWHDVLPGEGSSSGWLAVLFEGSLREVDWMTTTVRSEWAALEVEEPRVMQDCENLYQRLVDFPDDVRAALVVKATGVPSGVTKVMAAIQTVDPLVQLQAHAGNGIVIAKFAEPPSCGVAAAVNRIRAAAAMVHGHVIVLSNPSGEEMTHQCVWGAADVPYDLMGQVKRAFDPNETLNPGRFVYSNV